MRKGGEGREGGEGGGEVGRGGRKGGEGGGGREGGEGGEGGGGRRRREGEGAREGPERSRQSDRQHYVISRRRAVVFKCLTYSTFDDVTYDVILPLGWAGSKCFS